MTPYETLRALGAARETGTVFAVMAGNRQLRLGLVDGLVVQVTYAMKRGAAALAMLGEARCLSASFSRGIVGAAHADLPPPAATLEALRAAFSVGTVQPPSTPVAAGGPGAGPAATPGRAARTCTQALAELRALVVEQLGPIGDLLVDEAVQQGALSWDALVDALAREVTPEPAAQAFRAAARRLQP